MRFRRAIAALLLVLIPGLTGCAEDPAPGDAPGDAPDTDLPALKDVFADAFLIGAAVSPDHVFERDSVGAAILKKHFSSITSENALKWEEVHPEPDEYAWEIPDRLVEFGEENGMFIVGHTLVWHNQTPSWVFEDEDGNPISRDALIERMRDHISTVVGRYRGRVDAWDVVNEALNEDGSLRETPWMRIIGEEYLELAFEFAAEADPDAELYYNDYSLENPAKRDGAVRLVANLLEKGVRVDAIGTQAHHLIGPDDPSVERQAATIEAFAELGVDVMVTELDIAVLPRPREAFGADLSQSAELRDELNPYTEGLPDSVQTRLAERYASLFEVFLDHRADISRITFWGVRDSDSWLNNWPIQGRTAYPLVFDRAGDPKPAFHAIVDAAESKLR